MAITFIYPIKATGNNSLSYNKEDKESRIEKELENTDSSEKSLSYVMRDKRGNTYSLPAAYLEKMKNYISTTSENTIVFHTISSYLNCSRNTYDEWEMVRRIMNPKNGKTGNLQYCIVQNFGIDLNPEVANEIGVKFAQEYLSDYQCVVSTHINTGLVHNHIEFNATSFVTGKKFNDQLKTIDEIRKVSDKFCREYELDVLEDTKDFNVILYKDAVGNIKFYEPTERKNMILEGEYSSKNDYRNTEAFKRKMIFTEKDSHKNVLLMDIDMILPHVKSYEDLLEQLRKKNYSIKDKTKKGQWRKHISFKLPEWDKYIRDKELGEEYVREYLIEIIEKNQREQSKNKAAIEEKVRYEYGRIDIQQLDEHFYYRIDLEGNLNRCNRSDIERSIIIDTKKLDKRINGIIKKAMYQREGVVQKLSSGSKKEQYLLNRINGNLRTLQFIEEKDIKSFEQIITTINSLHKKQKGCYITLKQIGKNLSKMYSAITVIKKYNTLKMVINDNKDNEGYILHDKENDLKLLDAYEEILEKLGLLNVDSQKDLQVKYQEYNDKFEELKNMLESTSKSIKEYDSCIYNIKEADKEEQKYSQQIKEYYLVKEHYREEERS